MHSTAESALHRYSCSHITCWTLEYPSVSSSLADTLAHSPLHSVYTVKCLSMSSPIHCCSVYTEASRFLIICHYSHASLVGHWNVCLCLCSSLLHLIYLLLHTGVSSISAICRLPLLIPTHSSSVSTLGHSPLLCSAFCYSFLSIT